MKVCHIELLAPPVHSREIQYGVNALRMSVLMVKSDIIYSARPKSRGIK